jgi:hypothetical protein
MSHLAEVYAKDLGVKIGKPFFKPHFFPIIDTNYITIHHDNKSQSREYDYWDEVIKIVKYKKNIKFIQIGSGKEPKLGNADKFIATNSIKQCAYIIQNSLMHVGIDSLPAHIASLLDKPIVALYSSCYANNSKPLWGNQSKHILIESFGDNKPSFSHQELNKTINSIKPEKIANSILNLLGEDAIDFHTLYIGKSYKHSSLDVVPDQPYDIVAHNLSIRMDLYFNEQNIIPIVNKNQCIVVTDRAITKDILAHKNIKQVNYINDSFDEDFVSTLKSFGKNFILLCTSKDNLNLQRAKFFDEKIIYYNESEKIAENKNEITLDKFQYSSFKRVLKNAKIFNSYFDANGSENLDDFYLDLDHMFVYTVNHEQK